MRKSKKSENFHRIGRKSEKKQEKREQVQRLACSGGVQKSQKPKGQRKKAEGGRLTGNQDNRRQEIRIAPNQGAEFGLSYLCGRIYAVFVTQYAIRNTRYDPRIRANRRFTRLLIGCFSVFSFISVADVIDYCLSSCLRGK